MEQCTQKFLEMVKALKNATFEFGALKPYFLAQCILECGRGSTKLFDAFSNPFGMHYHDWMKDYAVGVEYDACDGKDIYAKFSSWDNVFFAYFNWFNHWPHYGDWKAAAAYGGEAFLKHIGPHYCPPGFTAEWAAAHDGLNYADYICKKLLPEARKLLTDAEEPVGNVTWYKTFPNKNDKSWNTVCAMDGSGNCVAKLDAGNISDVAGFMNRYGAHTIRRGTDSEVAPDVKDSPIPTTKLKVLLDPGHSKSKPGARSNSGTVKEEVLNLEMCEVILERLQQAGVTVDIYDPDPDNLTAVGEKGWGYDVMLSIHHNSYSGSGNPYVCCMVDPSADSKTKSFAQKTSQAIAGALKGTVAETPVFSGTDGMAGVYEAELSVINASRKGPKPPVHILVETYFLNKFTNQAECSACSKKAAVAIAQCTLDFFAVKPQTKSGPILPVAKSLTANFQGALTMGTVGIKETTEVLVAANELALSIVKHLKDGFQITDLIGIFTECAGPLKVAVDGCGQIPAEVADINLQEGMSLLQSQIAFIPRYLGVLTKV